MCIVKCLALRRTFTWEGIQCHELSKVFLRTHTGYINKYLKQNPSPLLELWILYLAVILGLYIPTTVLLELDAILAQWISTTFRTVNTISECHFRTQELPNYNLSHCYISHLQRFQSKTYTNQTFFSVSDIHVWTKNMGSGAIFGLRIWAQEPSLEWDHGLGAIFGLRIWV